MNNSSTIIPQICKQLSGLINEKLILSLQIGLYLRMKGL
jgi:hypothetical protein